MCVYSVCVFEPILHGETRFELGTEWDEGTIVTHDTSSLFVSLGFVYFDQT